MPINICKINKNQQSSFLFTIYSEKHLLFRQSNWILVSIQFELCAPPLTGTSIRRHTCSTLHTLWMLASVHDYAALIYGKKRRTYDE